MAHPSAADDIGCSDQPGIPFDRLDHLIYRLTGWAYTFLGV